MSPLASVALFALSLRTTLSLGLLLMVLLSSCTKTVVETVPGPTVYDTLHGPTLMRFLSMSPDARPIYLKRSREGSAPNSRSIAARAVARSKSPATTSTALDGT